MTAIDDDMISAVLADHRERRACPEHDRCTVQSVRAGCLCATTVAVIEHLQARSYSSDALATLREDIAAEIEDQMMDGHTRGACVASWQEAVTHCAAAVRALPLEDKP